MRIKVLRNLGRDLPPYKENQVVDVSDAEGERLIKLSLAEQTDEAISPGEIHAVPAKPAIARAAAVEKTAEDTSRRTATAKAATPETISKNPHG